MIRKMISMAVLAATVATVTIPASAMAQDHYRGDHGGYSQHDRQSDWNRGRGDDRGNWHDGRRHDHGYDDRGYRRDVSYRGDNRHDSHWGYDRHGYDRRGNDHHHDH